MSDRSKAKTKRGFFSHKSYMWVDKDPMIDQLRTAVADAKVSYADIEAAGGPKVGTLRSAFGGKTQRMMFNTIAATINSLPNAREYAISFASARPKIVRRTRKTEHDAKSGS